ncbi:MAG: response regulator [Planctomycetota bacterium]
MSAKSCVLVADDVANARRLYATALTSEGHGIIEARNGREALEKLQNHKVDVLVLDLAMPVMDGTAVMRSLAERGSTVPVVVVTSEKDPKALKTSPYPLAGLLTKPLNVGQFRKMVGDIIRASRHEAPAAPPKNPFDSAMIPLSPAVGGQLLNLGSLSAEPPPPYGTADLVADLLDLSELDRQSLRSRPLNAHRAELEIHRDSPRLERKVLAFRSAFAKGTLATKLLCVEYLPATLPTDIKMAVYKEWIFAKDHRIRSLIVHKVSTLRTPAALDLLMVCTEDNVAAVRQQALDLVMNTRLSELVEPLMNFYGARQIPLPPTIHKLLLRTNDTLVRELLTYWIKKAPVGHLKYLADLLASTVWGEGRDLAVRLLSHDDPGVRRHAARALGKYRDRTAASALVVATNDHDLGVRLEALPALLECPVKQSTKDFLTVCPRDASAPWSLYPSALKDLESPNSFLMRLTNNLPGRDLKDRMRKLSAFMAAKPDRVLTLFKKLADTTDRDKHFELVKLMQEMES